MITKKKMFNFPGLKKKLVVVVGGYLQSLLVLH